VREVGVGADRVAGDAGSKAAALAIGEAAVQHGLKNLDRRRVDERGVGGQLAAVGDHADDRLDRGVFMGADGLSLHDYFIARSIERLRPGGLGAFVTSRWTMDKSDPTARTLIASMADLVGAVRLPEGAMRAAAGNDVVVDILFFRKRLPDEPTKPVGWIELAEAIPAHDGEEALSITRYFVDRSAMVLGSHARTSSAYGPTYTCLTARSEPDALFQDLLAALHTLPADICVAPAAAKPERETLIDESIRAGTAAEGATIKEGSYLVVKGRLAQIIDGVAVAVPIRNGKGSDGIPARHARKRSGGIRGAHGPARERRIADDEIVSLGNARLGEVLGANNRVRIEEFRDARRDRVHFDAGQRRLGLQGFRHWRQCCPLRASSSRERGGGRP
jgi:hypothetical protein